MKFDELTDKLSGFDTYYQSELVRILDDLERKRKQAFSIFVIVVIIVAIVMLILVTLTRNVQIIIFSVFPASIIIGYFYQKIKSIKNQAKQVIMPELCHRFGMTYTIKPHDRMIEDYRELSLVPDFDEKTLEDEINGRAEDLVFNLFEAKLVSVNTDSKGRKTRSTVFKGILAKFDFHKNFDGTTIITKDWTAFGNFLSGLFHKGDRVKLEDPVFESEFEVYSTDQVEARYLRTPLFMQRILDFSRFEHIERLQFAFHQKKIFISMARSEDYFEGGGHDLNDPNYISHNIKDLGLIFNIIKDLNLNLKTKI